MNKNKKVLTDFVKYCEANPEQRFWQALRNWSGNNFIFVCNDPSGEGEVEDTFYFEGKNAKVRSNKYSK